MAKLVEKTLSSKQIYDGKVFKITKDDVELSDNRKTIREVVHHNGGVVIAAEKFDQILMINTFVRTRDGIKREHQFGIVVLNAGKRFKLALESLLTGKQVADLHVQARTRFFGNEVNFPAGFVAGSD